MIGIKLLEENIHKLSNVSLQNAFKKQSIESTKKAFEQTMTHMIIINESQQQKIISGQRMIEEFCNQKDKLIFQYKDKLQKLSNVQLENKQILSTCDINEIHIQEKKKQNQQLEKKKQKANQKRSCFKNQIKRTELKIEQEFQQIQQLKKRCKSVIEKVEDYQVEHEMKTHNNKIKTIMGKNNDIVNKINSKANACSYQEIIKKQESIARKERRLIQLQLQYKKQQAEMKYQKTCLHQQNEKLSLNQQKLESLTVKFDNFKNKTEQSKIKQEKLELDIKSEIAQKTKLYKKRVEMQQFKQKIIKNNSTLKQTLNKFNEQDVTSLKKLGISNLRLDCIMQKRYQTMILKK